MKAKFFICEHCGNEVVMIHHSGVTPVCCGESMKELVPNTKEAAYEKHIPLVVQEGNHVSVVVGSVEHPMVEAHFIKWIYVETTKGCQFKKLVPGEKPQATFTLSDEKLVAVYEYCNLHGLWVYEAK